ncbi:hypothetical protein V8C86DRAFT_3024584, partial [Haematococcus lacustris]
MEAPDPLPRLQTLHKSRGVLPSQLQLVRRLGEGAFATVDLCALVPPTSSQQQEQSAAQPAKQLVAVKQLKNTDDLQLRRMFCNEVELLLRLQHQHIASGLGMGFWDSSSEAAHLNSLFLVQEYVQGSHMRRAISNALVRQHRAGAPGFYSQADAVRWCLQLAQALDYLHTRSPPVIHRDVKLENILLTGTDPHTSDVKLIDFGLAVRLPRGSMKEAGSFLPAARRESQELAWTRSLSYMEPVIMAPINTSRRGAQSPHLPPPSPPATVNLFQRSLNAMLPAKHVEPVGEGPSLTKGRRDATWHGTMHVVDESKQLSGKGLYDLTLTHGHSNPSSRHPNRSAAQEGRSGRHARMPTSPPAIPSSPLHPNNNASVHKLGALTAALNMLGLTSDASRHSRQLADPAPDTAEVVEEGGHRHSQLRHRLVSKDGADGDPLLTANSSHNALNRIDTQRLRTSSDSGKAFASQRGDVAASGGQLAAFEGHSMGAASRRTGAKPLRSSSMHLESSRVQSTGRGDASLEKGGQTADVHKRHARSTKAAEPAAESAATQDAGNSGLCLANATGADTLGGVPPMSIVAAALRTRSSSIAISLWAPRPNLTSSLYPPTSNHQPTNRSLHGYRSVGPQFVASRAGGHTLQPKLPPVFQSVSMHAGTAYQPAARPAHGPNGFTGLYSSSAAQQDKSRSSCQIVNIHQTSDNPASPAHQPNPHSRPYTPTATPSSTGISAAAAGPSSPFSSPSNAAAAAAGGGGDHLPCTAASPSTLSTAISTDHVVLQCSSPSSSPYSSASHLGAWGAGGPPYPAAAIATSHHAGVAGSPAAAQAADPLQGTGQGSRTLMLHRLARHTLAPVLAPSGDSAWVSNQAQGVVGEVEPPPWPSSPSFRVGLQQHGGPQRLLGHGSQGREGC